MSPELFFFLPALFCAFNCAMQDEAERDEAAEAAEGSRGLGMRRRGPVFAAALQLLGHERAGQLDGAVTALDSAAMQSGRFLARNAAARGFALFYLLLFHVWALIVWRHAASGGSGKDVIDDLSGVIEPAAVNMRPLHNH